MWNVGLIVHIVHVICITVTAINYCVVYVLRLHQADEIAKQLQVIGISYIIIITTCILYIYYITLLGGG